MYKRTTSPENCGRSIGRPASINMPERKVPWSGHKEYDEIDDALLSCTKACEDEGGDVGACALWVLLPGDYCTTVGPTDCRRIYRGKLTIPFTG